MTNSIRFLKKEQANNYLHTIGLQVSEWNGLTDLGKRKTIDSPPNKAPRDSHELNNFAEHIAGWLPKGKWKIIQMNNSNYINKTQAYFLWSLLFGLNDNSTPDFYNNITIFFDFGNDDIKNTKMELILAKIMFICLLEEHHMEIASSGSTYGEYLSIQDGFVCFISDKKGQSKANILLNNLKDNRSKWILDIICEGNDDPIYM